LDHELALNIHENKIKADKYDNSIREFKEANLNNPKKRFHIISRGGVS
jgi:hypothetical protein